MRIKLVVALAGVLALALAGIAYAVQTQTADINFSSAKTGSATAIKTHFVVGDKANTTPGQEGKATTQIKRVDINFPRDMSFNDGAFPICTQNQADAARARCRKSILATGSTEIDGRGGPLGKKLTGKITAYNKKRALLLVISAPGTAIDKSTLNPTLSRTNQLITKLPPVLTQIQAFLSDFKLSIPVKFGRLKGKRVPYAQLPKRCPKGGKFVIKTTFYLANGKKSITKGTVNSCRR